MNITIDESNGKLFGLNAIVARTNEEGAKTATEEKPYIAITALDYITSRVNDMLESYNTQEIEKIKKDNEAFFTEAAKLPIPQQEQLKAIVKQLAETGEVTPAPIGDSQVP